MKHPTSIQTTEMIKEENRQQSVFGRNHILIRNIVLALNTDKN